MRIAMQFSIFMVNKPGVLAQVLGEFARAKLNITAMTVMDSVEHGVLRIVCVSEEKARAILASLNMPFNESEVLCVNLTNKSGALAQLAEKLARNHVNISYAYCTAGARGGRTTGVLKVADVKKAIKILESGKKKSPKSRPTVRRSKSLR